MYNITQADTDLANQIREGKTILGNNFNNNFQTHERTLGLIKNALDLSNTHSLQKNKIIWNTACYINIVSYDLKIIIKHITFSENEWEKRYFIRQACLLIYEVTDDLLKFFGKPLRDILIDLPDYELLKGDLNVLAKSINQYKKKNANNLKLIRNTAIAHRDEQSLEQLKIIYSISWIEAINYSSVFDNIIASAGIFLQTIMDKGIDDGKYKLNSFPTGSP